MDFTLFIIVFFLGGWLGSRLIAWVRLPGILGMVVFGIVLGTFARPAIPDTIWELAPFLTSVALIVILLRAGLGIHRQTLNRVGAPAILMGFVPALLEAAALTPMFMWLFAFPLTIALLAAFVLAAVSPAVVIPSMIALKERGFGRRADVPTLILAGASLDDVVAITLFTVLLQRASRLFVGDAATDTQVQGLFDGLTAFFHTDVGALVAIPVAIVGGLLVGALLGWVLSWWFGRPRSSLRPTDKTLVLLMLSLLVVEVAEWLPFAALLSVMTIGFILLERSEAVAHELANQLAKVWIGAEIILFVLIGMALEVEVAIAAGWNGLAVIGVGLIARSLGVLFALLLGRAQLTAGERLFCVLAYLPKATVQAALGSVPLAAGIPGGEIILAVAVLSILVTAPIGLVAIQTLGPRLLDAPEAR